LLYWTRVVLMPVAVAVLLTFLLDPVVSRLQRLRLPKTPAVILVVVAFVLHGTPTTRARRADTLGALVAALAVEAFWRAPAWCW